MADIIERLDALEEHVKHVKTEGRWGKGRRESKYRIVVSKSEGRRRSALDIMHEQGILFESDLKSIRNKDQFIEYLRKNGVIVLEGSKERVMITKEYLNIFLSELRKCRGPGDAEEKLKNEKISRLYRFLRDSGLLTYDSKSGWSLLT